MIDFEFSPASGGDSKPSRKPFTPFADWSPEPAQEAISDKIPPFVDGLNPMQREAVLITDGPLIVLAGAGSGKTKMLTSRIAYLIETRRAQPHQVLAVTFTNKAAAEMRERVERTLGQDAKAKGGHWGFQIGVPEIGTFHSVCMRLLRREQSSTPFTKPFVIYDDSDQLSLIKDTMNKLGIDEKAFSPKGIQAAINRAKCDAVEPHELEPAQHNLHERQVKRVYEQYQKDLFANNALDFGEIICMAYRLLRDHKDIREKYQKRFRYIHVDEYQDTNRSQYLLLTMLANPKFGGHGNICVVGDEDQSIYKWRGADIRNILEFEKDFPEARTIRLEQNYRSTQVILEGASAVVAQNTQRKGKNLWTSREGGSLIGFYEAPDGEGEAIFIADRIHKYLRAAGEQEDAPRCAVLYRTNSQSRLVEEALRRYQIQYHMVGGFSFYDRSEVKDILSYMKLVQNPNDSIALGRIINSPARGIGKTTLETLERMALTTGMSTWDALARAIEDKLLPARALTALASFKRLIEDARAMLGPLLTGQTFEEKLASDLAEAAEALTDFNPDEFATDADTSFATEEFVTDSDTSFSPDSFATEPATEEATTFPPTEGTGAQTSFDTSFNFGFDFGPSEEVSTIAAENSVTPTEAVSFNPFAPVAAKQNSTLKKSAFEARRSGDSNPADRAADRIMADEPAAFRKPGEAATLPELIKFLNDRSGYIRSLEEEATPESFSRIENLKELANAAQDAQERGETLHEFLDHAALVSDADSYSAEARVTLMTLHAAKGLEFPLVFLTGMEEGLFPSGRTLTDPGGLEEERRLCYVGMTRAMDTLVMTRARYRRRYGSDMPESSIPSRFLEEVPQRLMEDLGSPAWRNAGTSSAYNSRGNSANDDGERHYSYEDEDQTGRYSSRSTSTSNRFASSSARTATPGQSRDNIANFFAGRGQKPGQPFGKSKLEIPEPTGKTGIAKGTRVRHPKYGDGVVFQREGDGDDAKITVQFQQHGVKKLVEKFAQLVKL
jgi:DNA helicase-2/ATP-dependent DNA helicase PcrA